MTQPTKEGLLNTLYNLINLVFVLGTMASIGLSLTIAQISGPLRNARRPVDYLARLELRHPHV